MAKRVDEQTIAAIRRMFADGKSISQVQALTGLSRATVCKYKPKSDEIDTQSGLLVEQLIDWKDWIKGKWIQVEDLAKCIPMRHRGRIYKRMRALLQETRENWELY